MASIASININEILPGLEEFLRSMLNSTQLDVDHRQSAAKYLNKLDQLTQSTTQQSSIIDDQSFMNTDFVSDEESDDFTDEEEEEQQKQITPAVTRHLSLGDNQLYNSTIQETNSNNNKWYVDLPENDYTKSQVLHEHNDNISNRLSTSQSLLSSIIASGLLLTYDKNHNWIWRYYVLDDFDLICFPADKISRLTINGQIDNNCSPLWVSDMTNAKVHLTTIDKVDCLCLEIGLAEAIYVRPSDPNQINVWYKTFQDASSTHKTKTKTKRRNNMKTLSRNARRMFAQFNRKKGQIVSHLLDQMANVTGADDKIRKHCELRGFLIISFDNSTFITKYCTIVDGIFRIHKSRLSEQTDYEFNLNQCVLSFPEERTRDIQFTLTDKHIGKIFIRGNNIYTMGRLLNNLSKYVEIQGTSQNVFQSNQTNGKSLPLNLTKTFYRNASDFHDDRMIIYPLKQTSNNDEKNSKLIQSEKNNSNETYEQPRSYVNITHLQQKKTNENTLSESRSSTNNCQTQRSKSNKSYRNSSPDLISKYSSSSEQSQHRNIDQYPNPIPRRKSFDFINKLTDDSNEHDQSTQTYDRIPSIIQNSNGKFQSTCFHDIPITIEQPTKFPLSSFEHYENETTNYDNIPNVNGIGKFRFIIPFNHSPSSAFTSIKSSSNSTLQQTTTSNNRTRLMTAV